MGQSGGRQYKALDVPCPECGSKPGWPCVRAVDEGGPHEELRGVHRARDLAYNRQQAREPDLWEPKR